MMEHTVKVVFKDGLRPVLVAVNRIFVGKDKLSGYDKWGHQVMDFYIITIDHIEIDPPPEEE